MEFIARVRVSRPEIEDEARVEDVTHDAFVTLSVETTESREDGLGFNARIKTRMTFQVREEAACGTGYVSRSDNLSFFQVTSGGFPEVEDHARAFVKARCKQVHIHTG